MGPVIARYMFRTYKTYTGAFYAAGILALIAFACMMVARRPEAVVVRAKAEAQA